MSAVDLSFRIGGEAGQGVESSASGFATALTRGGLYVVGVADYYSRIRGGHNYFTIRAADHPILAVKETIEVLLALNAETASCHLDKLVPAGVLIVDEDIPLDAALLLQRDVHLVRVPMAKIAEEQGARVMQNTAALAVAAGVVGFDLGPILSVIEDNFRAKGSAIVEGNRRVARIAFQLATERFGALYPKKVGAREAPPRVVMDANHAFALGSLMAGCKFVAGYPMTPSTSVLEYMAQHAATWGLVVKHAEDEIAAVNMCIGAGHAGVRTLVATSGGGFDLMTEGLSLAAMTETPLVVYLGQRPGPATGLATRTAQADLLLALYASHGEFPRVLLAPHTPDEAFGCAVRAFNIAEKYQCIVIVLSDEYNATTLLTRSVEAYDPTKVIIERGKLLSADQVESLASYQRYAITPDGVSPRALPGSGPMAVYLASGNEHREDGHITEDPALATAMLDKRLRKLEGARAAMRPPLAHGPREAEVTFVSWGSSYGPVYEAMSLLNSTARSANMVHFVDLWPLPVEATRQALASARRIVDVEGNATAQLAFLLRAYAGIDIDQEILKYDGRGFTPEYILARLEDH